MQTEAPRPDGGAGLPGLRLRGDVTGTDRTAWRWPRTSARAGASGRVTTVVEQDLSLATSAASRGAVRYDDSVGVGSYRIDLHPSTGGDNYIDVGSLPVPDPARRAAAAAASRTCSPAGKNIGTTHITNGCYRLHPVEWNIGEVAGALAAHCLDTRRTPSQVRSRPEDLAVFQRLLLTDGVELGWPQVAGY